MNGAAYVVVCDTVGESLAGYTKQPGGWLWKLGTFTFKVGGGLGWYLLLILSTFFQTLASSVLLLSVDTYQEEFWESFCALWNIARRRFYLILLLTVGRLFVCFWAFRHSFLRFAQLAFHHGTGATL